MGRHQSTPEHRDQHNDSSDFSDNGVCIDKARAAEQENQQDIRGRRGRIKAVQENQKKRR